jgi:hypothetical protein
MRLPVSVDARRTPRAPRSPLRETQAPPSREYELGRSRLSTLALDILACLGDQNAEPDGVRVDRERWDPEPCLEYAGCYVNGRALDNRQGDGIAGPRIHGLCPGRCLYDSLGVVRHAFQAIDARLAQPRTGRTQQVCHERVRQRPKDRHAAEQQTQRLSLKTTDPYIESAFTVHFINGWAHPGFEAGIRYP